MQLKFNLMLHAKKAEIKKKPNRIFYILNNTYTRV